MGFPVNGGNHTSTTGSPMRHTHQYTRLTPRNATQHLRPVLSDWLGRSVRLPTGRTVTPERVWQVILFAAAFTRSIAAACAALTHAPSGQAVWNALRAVLPKRRRTLERHLLWALHAPLGPRTRSVPVWVAIDYHAIAYYGDQNRDTTRGKAMAGTHTSHTYATACIAGAPRYTVALSAVSHKEAMTAVLTRILGQIADAGVRVRGLLLDKAFFTVPVMLLLQEQNLPFVIPAQVRGRKPRPGVKATGIRAMRQRRAGRWAYTQTGRGGASVAIDVVVAYKNYRRKLTGRRRTRKLLYAVWRVRGCPVSIRDRYRTRFGIESSYRQLGDVRPRTSTTDGVIRLLWVAVGLILRNAWVRFGGAGTRGWTLAAMKLVILVGLLNSAQNPGTPNINDTTRQRPPT